MPDYLNSNESEEGISDFLQFSKQAATACPVCGKKMQSIGNIKMTKCPFCRSNLESSGVADKE